MLLLVIFVIRSSLLTLHVFGMPSSLLVLNDCMFKQALGWRKKQRFCVADILVVDFFGSRFTLVAPILVNHSEVFPKRKNQPPLGGKAFVSSDT